MLAEATAGEGSNGVSHTTVDLNIDNEALVLGGFVNGKELAAYHRHPYAKYLTRTDAAPVHGRGIQQWLIKRTHGQAPQIKNGQSGKITGAFILLFITLLFGRPF